MARSVNVKEAEQRDNYYYLSHCFSHIDLSAIMNHRCLGKLTGMEFVLKIVLRVCVFFRLTIFI